MPGLSVYIIGFTYQGYYYEWSNVLNCFISTMTNERFYSVPIGAHHIKSSREC